MREIYFYKTFDFKIEWVQSEEPISLFGRLKDRMHEWEMHIA